MITIILQMWGSLLIAALFGVFFGWLLWGSLVRRLRYELEEAQDALSQTDAEEAPRTLAAAVGFFAEARPTDPLRSLLDPLFEPLNPDEISQRAFEFSQLRGFQGGSEQEDWLRAERQIHLERLEALRDSLGTD